MILAVKNTTDLVKKNTHPRKIVSLAYVFYAHAYLVPRPGPRPLNDWISRRGIRIWYPLARKIMSKFEIRSAIALQLALKAQLQRSAPTATCVLDFG